jgi:hypothetical protein
MALVGRQIRRLESPLLAPVQLFVRRLVSSVKNQFWTSASEDASRPRVRQRANDGKPSYRRNHADQQRTSYFNGVVRDMPLRLMT